MNPGVTSKAGYSGVEDMPANDEDLDFEGLDGLGEFERVSVKWRFFDFRESCCVKRRKVSDTVTETVIFADALVKQGIDRNARAASDIESVALPCRNTSLGCSRID